MPMLAGARSVGRMSQERSRSPVRRDEPPQEDEVSEEFKAFVGGISWHISDRELKDSEPRSRFSLLSFQA